MKYLHVPEVLGMNFQEQVNMLIEAGSCKEVHLIVDSVGQWGAFRYVIETNLSWNIPVDVNISLNFSKRRVADLRDTVIIIDSTFFNSPPNEIVVDDADSGFRVKEEQVLLLQRWFVKPEKYRTALPRARWEPYVSVDAYGDVVRSFHARGGGRGKSKVEWNAMIKETGVYKLFIRNPGNVFGRSYYYEGKKYSYKNPALHEYCFYHDNKKEEITLFLEFPESRVQTFYSDGRKEEVKYHIGHIHDCWYPVGQYELNPGEIKLVLYGKALAEDEFMIADAVKWVKMD